MQKQRFSTRIALPFVVLPLVLGLAACGSKEEKKSASQVAVKVNGSEISVHQLNQILQRTPASASPEQAAAMRKEVLEKLVDQQLAIDQAVEKKLDRSPEVMAAIDAARREILARAYIEQLNGGVPKPSAEEVRAYYTKNPALFAERRVFNLQEIVIPNAPAGLADELRGMLTAGKPIEEIAKALKAKDIKFGGGAASRPAEQIPLEILPKLHALKDGQGIVVEAPQGITLMRVAASQAAPVNEEQATPRIQQFLFNQRASDAAVKKFKELRDAAKITYVGDFANDAPAAKPAAAAAPAPAAKPAADPAAKAIEKGVAGLK